MIRLVEGAVAVGFGAADAMVQSKTGTGPGGVPWVVIFEGAGAAAGLFGDKIGVPSEMRDPLAFASLSLIGARLAHAAQAGTLAQGPKAWGGAVGGYSPNAALNPMPQGVLPASAAASIRLLPGRSATQSAFSMSPTLFEAAGVTG